MEENKAYSQPVIIEVTNLSDHDLENVELFDALERMSGPFDLVGNFRTDELLITSERIISPKLTYKNIILSIATGDILEIGKTIVHFKKTENKVKVIVLSIMGYELNGIVFNIKIHGYNHREDNKSIIPVSTPFSIGKRISLTLEYLAKGSMVQIIFYPAVPVNVKRSILPLNE